MKLFNIVLLASVAQGQTGSDQVSQSVSTDGTAAVTDGTDATGEDPEEFVCIRDGKEVICSKLRGVMDTSASDDIDEREDNRYSDMEDMNKKHWRKHKLGSKWDTNKFWAYGCHCLLLGDPSESGHGAPIDSLDSACQMWKNCQKCTREEHGDLCVGETVKYTWKFSWKSGTMAIMNPPGTCARSIGECDLKLVHDTFNFKDQYDEANSHFYGSFDKNDNCIAGNGGARPAVAGNELATAGKSLAAKKVCCGGDTGPWYWVKEDACDAK